MALPHLRGGGGGAFISISSVEARRAFLYHAAYAASEHAGDNQRPLPGWGRSEGSFSRGAWSRSAYNWPETRASLRRLRPAVLRPPRFRDRSEPSTGSA